MDYKFKVVFLTPVLDFMESLDPESREKVIYNIWKSEPYTINST